MAFLQPKDSPDLLVHEKLELVASRSNSDCYEVRRVRPMLFGHSIKRDQHPTGLYNLYIGT